MAFRAHVFVSGRVQGVFYRASTRDTAMGLGLAGWVRNLSDGRVEAVFQGEEDVVRTAVAWCRKGPDGSRVEDVETIFDEELENLTTFSIRY